MNSQDFVELSAYIRLLEKRLLSAAAIARILEASGSKEVLRQISQNSGYDFTVLKRSEDYEGVLRESLLDLYAFMYKESPRREVVDIAAAKYDFHNLKVMLKARYGGVDAKTEELLINVSSQSPEAFDGLAAGNLDGVSDYLAAAVLETAEMFEDGEADPQVIDVVADRHMFKRMLDLCEIVGSGFIEEYVRLSIDFHNIKTMFRVINMKKGPRFLAESLVAGGKTDMSFFCGQYDKTPEAIASALYYKYFGDMVKNGVEGLLVNHNLSKLEKLLDDRLVEHIRGAKYIAFGPEVPFAYILSKENEIRQIRILVTCANVGLRPEAARERLRENYA